MLGLGLQLLHEGVVVVRVVVEDGEALDVRRPAEAHGFLPRGMAPAHLGGEFVVGVGAIVNQQVRPFDEAEDVGVGLARDVFGIGDVARRLAAVFDAVAGGPVGMVEGRRPDLDVRIQAERFAGREVLETEIGLHGVEGHGKRGSGHPAGEDVLDTDAVRQVPGHDVDGALGVEGRGEKGKPVDVVPVGMGQKHVGLAHVVAEEFAAQPADAGPGVEHESAVAQVHFDATGIAAVLDVLGRGARDAAAHPPELHRKRHIPHSMAERR